MATRKSLTPLELEIMQLVWERDADVSVRDIYEALRTRRPIAYTTVMTMMGVLTGKGHLRRRPRARAFVYRAAASKSVTVRRMVTEFVDRVFGGSTDALLVHLADEHDIDHAELAALRKRLDDEEQS